MGFEGVRLRCAVAVAVLILSELTTWQAGCVRIFCRYVLRDTQEECRALLLTHAKASGFIALHRVYNTIEYSLQYYCLLHVYMLIYREGKGRHSSIVCKASHLKCTRALCHSLEGKGEGHCESVWSH